MSDALLSSPDREEALSRAYATAVAAGAGYLTYKPDLDRDSVDTGFWAGGRMMLLALIAEGLGQRRG
jgi:hypothetical protein